MELSTLEVKRQPHELIDCAAGNRLIQTSLVVVGSDLDVARVSGVLDATVSVPAAKPLLERPAVEGIAPFPRYNRSQNDLHGVPFVSIRTAIGLSTIRPNWHDAVLGLGHANNHPPDRRTST
jgi:hypothetical protein